MSVRHPRERGSVTEQTARRYMGKHAYQEKLRRQVCQWQAGIDRLKVRLQRVNAETRRELEHRVRDLQAKQQAARRKLEQLDRLDHAGKSTRSRAGKTAWAVLYGARRAIQKIASGIR